MAKKNQQVECASDHIYTLTKFNVPENGDTVVDDPTQPI
jgi:hypothetical protein